MSEIVIHLALFLLVSLAIVLLGAFYSEAEDGKALRSVPRRLMVFLLGCGALAGVMLICEHTFAAL